MPVEVILPKVDMDMTHGTLAVWHVSPGDEVAKGAALLDIETDKAAMEVEAPASGRLHAVTAQPGDRVAVGTVLALIYAEGEEISAATPAPAAAVAPAPAGPVAAALAPAETAPVADDARDDALRATPAARAAARRS
ncbi:MAG: lipoyl domain-containing protein, partial [Pseudomonadota bacterium]